MIRATILLLVFLFIGCLMALSNEPKEPEQPVIDTLPPVPKGCTLDSTGRFYCPDLRPPEPPQ